MNVYVVSLYPDRVIRYFDSGVLKRAVERRVVHFIPVLLRDFGIGKHNKVDDYSYGGGPGMVLRVDVLTAAIEQIPNYQEARLVMFSPRGLGLPESVEKVRENSSDLILVCGSFEGIDERFMECFNVMTVSLGDVVVSSGDAVAIPFLDAYLRRLPGVLGNHCSLVDESFEAGLLEYPQYTVPKVFRKKEVPAILLSGHHEKVSDWRHRLAFQQTVRLRPDLLNHRSFNKNEIKWMTELLEVNEYE